MAEELSRSRSRDDYHDLITHTDALRARLDGPLTSPEALQRCLGTLRESGLARESARGRDLVLDLEDFLADGAGPNRHLARVKRAINAGDDRVILSAFDVAYFPSLSLEALVYDRLAVPAGLSKYSTNVVPANMVCSTAGFTRPEVVALFPENHVDHVQHVGDSIFYFIDKFVDRFMRLTRQLLELGVDRESFEVLRHAKPMEVQTSAIYWVWLHEYFHRQGPLPLPEALDIKSYRPLAGLEECRVDMHGLIALDEDTTLDSRERGMAAQFILAERLLRYAIEGIPRPNYDAIGSQILFNFLRGRGFVRIAQGRLSISPEIMRGVKEFAEHLTNIEAGASRKGRLEVKQDLVAFSRRFTNYDHTDGKYRHDPFFLELRGRLPATPVLGAGVPHPSPSLAGVG
jgi:uncharacterized protein DUF6421